MTEHETPHLPPPSLWPLGFAVGIACILTGLVVSTIVAVVGAAIAIVFGFLWIRDVTKPVRTPAAEVEPEARTAAAPAVARVDEDGSATYPRSTFLSAATLGLGGVIGGLITVPVLGFAVLPPFMNQEDEEVELGPIEEFPEGQFVIATFMKDPEVGEVTSCVADTFGDGRFVFVTRRSNVNLGAKTMTNVPKKHVGIGIGNTIWHYSNTRDQVVTATPDEFIYHYRGQENGLFWGMFPDRCTPVPFGCQL